MGLAGFNMFKVRSLFERFNVLPLHKLLRGRGASEAPHLFALVSGGPGFDAERTLGSGVARLAITRLPTLLHR